MKYGDQEGDMVNVTTNEELRWTESPSGQMGSVKLYIVEVKLEQDPFCDHVEFSQLFNNYVGFNSDDYSNLYELGMKLYTDAMEDTITSEESQERCSC
ncbi:hypothetical protein HanXRQr2_Chr02g0061011 [Helianthus annuus]|uniref:Uncharacterized protein n=1 Tax=Helianthus annuus TaxID=4232 RepID=A0A9K3JP47_HELAN|nr:hypothetical protein HanXRQr2_Chr02g0061011 [Helianthus annuus]KAJ0630535.1 putative protein PHOX1-4 [Helianthus annuus]KAJ0951447.1 hypothetical protein HanPSC8_Chr02g0060101 [Helianthus annuus]